MKAKQYNVLYLKNERFSYILILIVSVSKHPSMISGFQQTENNRYHLNMKIGIYPKFTANVLPISIILWQVIRWIFHGVKVSSFYIILHPVTRLNLFIKHKKINVYVYFFRMFYAYEIENYNLFLSNLLFFTLSYD